MKLFGKINLFFLITALIVLHAQEQKNIVAKAGNIVITKKEFRERYEFTPHVRTKTARDSASTKCDFLYTLIAEKLLAQSANKEALIAFYKKGLTVNTETTPAKVFGSILADNFTSYGSMDSKTKEQLIGQLGFFWKLVPDLKWEPLDIIIEGDKFVVRSIATGTPNGDFMGLPTNGTKSFKMMTIDVHKIVGGKIVEVHHLEDWGTAMQQLKG